MFNRVEACNADGSVLRAYRQDGTIEIVEASSPAQLLARARAGEWGAVLPYSGGETDGRSAVPISVELAQLKIQLGREGILQQTADAMAGTSEDQIIWAGAATVKSTGRVAAILRDLGKSGAQIEAIFKAAARVDL